MIGLPYMAAGSAALILVAGMGGYFKGHSAGVQQERHTWQAARTELLALRTKRANQAADDLARQSAAVAPVVTKETIRVETHWRDHPVRECFDTDLVQSLEEARRTIRQPTASSPSND